MDRTKSRMDLQRRQIISSIMRIFLPNTLTAANRIFVVYYRIFVPFLSPNFISRVCDYFREVDIL